MLRVRVLTHVDCESDIATMAQVEKIARKQFPLATTPELKRLTERLEQPLTGAFSPLLFVMEDFEGKVSAFASVLVFSSLKLAHLEFISTAPNRPSSGLGGVLYDRLREHCKSLGCHALLFECLADDTDPSQNQATHKLNQKR